MDEKLSTILEIAREFKKSRDTHMDTSSALTMCEAFLELHEHMSNRGYLPSEWDRVARKRPRYIHDCEKCKFLGTWEAYDLYFCDEKTLGGTVIARYGSNAPMYAAMHVSLTKTLDEKTLHSTYSPALRVGALIAQDMGLWVEK